MQESCFSENSELTCTLYNPFKRSLLFMGHQKTVSIDCENEYDT